MRVSVDDRDPACDHALAMKVKDIRLDGVVVPLCITADTDTGYILAYVTGQSGGLIFSKGGTVADRRELHGKVEILMR